MVEGVLRALCHERSGSGGGGGGGGGGGSSPLTHLTKLELGCGVKEEEGTVLTPEACRLLAEAISQGQCAHLEELVIERMGDDRLWGMIGDLLSLGHCPLLTHLSLWSSKEPSQHDYLSLNHSCNHEHHHAFRSSAFKSTSPSVMVRIMWPPSSSHYIKGVAPTSLSCDSMVASGPSTCTVDWDSCLLLLPSLAPIFMF